MRSGLYRPFDLRLISNRFVLLATPVIGLVAGGLTLFFGDGFIEGIRRGFGAGGAAFVAWVITRDLHPDRPGAAAAAALIAPWGVLLGTPDLLAAAVILVVARVVSGPTGRGVRWLDVGWVGGLAAVAAFRDAALAPLVVGAFALMATAVIAHGYRRETAVLGAVLGTLAVTALILGEPTAAPTVDGVLLGGLAAGAMASAGPRRVVSETDDPGGWISPHRVRSARLVATAAAGLATVVVEPATLAPVWAALAAVAIRPT